MRSLAPRWRRVVAGPAVVALAVTALAACTTTRPSAGEADATAADFYRAIGASDGAAACALLTPSVAETLEQDAGSPCPQAVLDGDVGQELTARADGATDPGAASGRVDGRQAQVVTSTDTVFLTVSGDGWRITAAGCDPHENRPYDCVVEAG